LSPQLTAATAIYALILAGLATLACVRPPKRRSHLRTGAVMLEALLICAAGLSVWTQLRGHQPAEPAVHLAYLACSVLLLPVLMARPGPVEQSRWDDAVLAAGAVAVAGRGRTRGGHLGGLTARSG